MPIFNRTPAEDPQTLKNEIVAARQQYEATKQDVISRAVTRQSAVRETITDLQAESAELTSVIDEARGL